MPSLSYSNLTNETRSSWLPRGMKTDRVLRILLNHPSGDLTRYRIAVMADIQQIQLSMLLRQFESRGLVRGTKVRDYRGLIYEWARRKINFQSQRYMLKGIMDLLRTTHLRYAITTYQAETLVNNYLFPTRTDLYIDRLDFDKWHNELVNSHALVGGGNVTLRLYDSGVFYNSFDTHGYHVVSIPQLIVDLIREGGVAHQAAEMLIQKQETFLSSQATELKKDLNV